MTDASKEVDARLKAIGGWRGKALADVRALIKRTDPAVVEEMKWKKPSNSAGVPVWSHEGIICTGEALKNAVRLTFPKGAALKHSKLFNARLEGNAVRAIDLSEGDRIDEVGLKALVAEAIKLNTSQAKAKK